MTILDLIDDPKFFAPWFTPAESWRTWRVLLATIFGLPLTSEELKVYQQCTGRAEPPPEPFREAWIGAGRRSGKSLKAALISLYLCCFRDYSQVLTRGEHAVVMCLAADRRQAGVVFKYASAFVDETPLKEMVERRTAEAIHFTNGVSLEVHTSSFRSVRGYTLVGAVLDEVAFWRDDSSANPDVEVVAALRPGMVTIPDAMLIGISSPYARRGVLWQQYREHFGKDGSGVLFWQAPTLAMNSTVDPAIIERAYAEDPASAAAEYGAEFRSDIESFVSREAVDAVTVPGRLELPRVEGVRYSAFTDPAGGSGADSMTLAIGHREDRKNGAEREGVIVLDLVREIRPPFSPEQTCKDLTAELQRYRVRTVVGDRYAGEWPREQFRKAGIEYKTSEKAKSDIYRDALPVITSCGCELLDLPKLQAQLCSLERRTSRGGRDSIDHPPGRTHDDVANSVCGVVVALAEKRERGARIGRTSGHY